MIDSILVWNIRGVGTSRTRLKTLVGRYKPKIVALLEPFQNLEGARKLARSLKFDMVISNEVEGGKIWLLWDSIYKVQVDKLGMQFISVVVENGADKILIHVIYAKCSWVERRYLWQELSSNHVGVDPCVVVGDFNIIKNDSERRRGRPRPNVAMDDFNDWIHQRGLMEMAAKGSCFSWCNGQSGLARSWAWLDRALMDNSFSNLFPNTICSYLSRSTSDHAPMIIEFKKDPFSYGPSPFRFQQMWVDHPGFLDCVRAAWNLQMVGSLILCLSKKLKHTKVVLREWNKRVFGHTIGRIDALEKQIEEIELQLQSNWEVNLERELHEAVSNLAGWRHREEMRLAQMAKLKWKRKRVLEMRSNGITYESPESIHQGAVEFFQDSLRGEPPIEQSRLEGLIETVILEEENVSLIRPPTLEEVFEAVSSIPNQSTPGPDGFGAGFYKNCWEVVKVDVWKAVVEFFMIKDLPRFFTASYLVLIPKMESPTGFDKFCPISLCSVFYKICSKIIVSRLTGILPRLISLEQGAFIPGRSIF
ncbi:uncharacterized protein LOC121247323 [Juglans microcarpa x Juglans regia]|uniref:uncharacterized protein LOC121247323 n=1 Tax=Juglans microcarpa x Juglans regia TaxID=2249226 RepID=UPI001B7ED1AB|nr:uncharacterized protein LOC121247323 [Juglans microcarpa x Juglans regia]